MKCVHGRKSELCSEWSEILSRIEKAYSAGQRGTLMGRDQDDLRRWFPTCKESIFSGSKEYAHGNEWGQLCGKDTEEEKSSFFRERKFSEKGKKKKERKRGSGLLLRGFFWSPDWERFFFSSPDWGRCSRIILELPEVAATPASEHIHRPHHLQHNLGEIHVFKRRTISRLHRSPRKGEESSPSCTFGIGRSTIIISERGTHAPLLRASHTQFLLLILKRWSLNKTRGNTLSMRSFLH